MRLGLLMNLTLFTLFTFHSFYFLLFTFNLLLVFMVCNYELVDAVWHFTMIESKLTTFYRRFPVLVAVDRNRMRGDSVSHLQTKTDSWTVSVNT